METVVGTEFTTPRLTKTFERSFKMSSEYIKHNGQRKKKSEVISRGKKYKYNKTGKLVEIGGIDPDTGTTVVQGADDFVIGGTKSSLRRIADIESNVAILYTKLTTADGTTASNTESSDDISVGKSGTTTRFKGGVKFEANVDAKSSASVTATFANKVVNASNAIVGVSVSNDTLTFTQGDGGSFQRTISDADTNRYLTGLSFSTSNGVLTATRNGLSALTVDLDGRYQLAGNYQPAGSYAAASHTHSISEVSGLQSALNAKATPSDITTAINNLVNGAPAALNTLNELAAAIGDNASYAASVTTALGNKVSTGSSEYIKGATVSNDTITFTRGDNSTFSVTTSDANSNTYVTGASFATSTGVLTLTRNSGSVTVDLDGRYQAAGSYASTGTSITAGNGLTGGGSLAANRTINVGGGNGITVSADGVAMSGSYTGTFTASGDVCAYSDASLKTNVQTIEGALDKVAAVRGVTFERIADGSVSAGVVAQELEAVLPEAVKTDEEGVKMVAYGNITGLLIEAVKELSAQVEELKKNQK